jgi:hypothetical protein
LIVQLALSADSPRIDKPFFAINLFFREIPFQ